MKQRRLFCSKNQSLISLVDRVGGFDNDRFALRPSIANGRNVASVHESDTVFGLIDTSEVAHLALHVDSSIAEYISPAFQLLLHACQVGTCLRRETTLEPVVGLPVVIQLVSSRISEPLEL